jgi:putative PEP-CTERM system histidine kinase
VPPISDGDPLLAPFHQSDTAWTEFAASAPAEWQARFKSGWLLIPLRYQNSIAGLVLVMKPRAPRKLDWEDDSLLRLVAAQLAVYLVQEEIAEALADARQLESLSKRSAFIIHDLKNAIGQLSLLVSNAEKFGRDPEFQEDMAITLRHSVKKLQELLARLKNVELPSDSPSQGTNLDTLVSEFVADKTRLGIRLVACAPSTNISVLNPDAIRTVLEHVVSNAVDASPANATVELRIQAGEREVSIDVADKGEGMSPEFVAKELFRPLRSTKQGGLGIGAYQAREMMRGIGGDIRVQSRVGQGTTVTLTIPTTGSNTAFVQP